MKSKNKNIIAGMAFIGLCIAAGTWGIIKKQKLKSKRKVCVAQITNYTAGGPGNAGAVRLDYTIAVNGKTYEGSSLYQISDLEIPTAENSVILRTFPAVYDPADPSKSSLMILPEDFNNNGYTFPDSLNWLLPYIKTINSPVQRIR